MVSMTLRYTGGQSDNGVIDMYDAARGLAGFQRSLALTAHLVLNGEIITQAPALKNAQIISSTPEEGSWKVTAIIVSGIFAVATASNDSPLGHLMYSAYDYVVSNTLGFHVDYEKSLGLQYEEYLARKKITSDKMDSLIEKTEASIADLHRPIVASESATQAEIMAYIGRSAPRRVGPLMSELTYEYLATTVRDDRDNVIEGVVSSFNINTFKGRIFSYEDQRPIPFELGEDARDRASLVAITTSLRSNASDRFNRMGGVRLTVTRLESSTGRLKALIAKNVEEL